MKDLRDFIPKKNEHMQQIPKFSPLYRQNGKKGSDAVKKFVLMFLILTLCVCACAKNEFATGKIVPETEQNNPEEVQPSASGPNVTISAEAVTEKGCTLVIETDYAEGEITTGSMFYIKKDGKKLPALFPDEEIAWTMELYMIAPEITCSINQNWEYLYGDLSAGTYEIVKQIYIELPGGEVETKEISAEFELAYVD